MSDEIIQAEVARLKESLVPLLKRAVTKIAQKACRNGENETREWPPLMELPYLESWVVVGEKYGEAVFGVLHATLHNTISKHVEQFEKKFKEYELAVNENVEVIARLDKLEEEKDKLIDKLEKDYEIAVNENTRLTKRLGTLLEDRETVTRVLREEHVVLIQNLREAHEVAIKHLHEDNATLRKRAELAEQRIIHAQAYNEKQLADLRSSNRSLQQELGDAKRANNLLSLNVASAMADLDTLTKALNNQDEKIQLYVKAGYSEELASKMPAILASAEAGGWRKDLIGFPDFLINWLATKLPDLTTVANLKKSVRIQKEEIDAFKVLNEGKDAQLAQCKARLEANVYQELEKLKMLASDSGWLPATENIYDFFKRVVETNVKYHKAATESAKQVEDKDITIKHLRQVETNLNSHCENIDAQRRNAVFELQRKTNDYATGMNQMLEKFKDLRTLAAQSGWNENESTLWTFFEGKLREHCVAVESRDSLIERNKQLIAQRDSEEVRAHGIEAHKEVLEKENKKLSETARKYVDVTALAMRYGYDPTAVDLPMFLIGRMESLKGLQDQSDKVADLRTKLEEKTRSLNALNVKVSTLEATASEHGWNGSDTLPFFFSNRMADLKACRAELTNLKAKLEETNRLHTAHKEHYEEVVRVAKQHGYNGNDFVHQFLNQKLLQLLGRLSGLESLALKFGWVRDDKGPFEFFERALRSPYETLTPYRQLGYRFHWDDNEEELLEFLEKKLRANIEMSNTATFSVDAVKSLHKGLNRIDSEDMGRVYKNYSDYTYDQFKMASKDWLSFLAWPGHESYAGAILRLAEKKAGT